MTWFKLDDRFDEHPKFVGLSDKALALWLKGLAPSAPPTPHSPTRTRSAADAITVPEISG